MAEPAIDIRELSFAYGHEPALQDVTLSVAGGGTLGLIGPNGAGKTTLVKIILGELRGYTGEIRVLGRPPGELPRGGLIGYVPQHRTALGRFPLTAESVVRLGLARRRGMFRRFTRGDRDAADEALAAVQMQPFARRAMERLSGGQVQRVCIARALVAGPEILILDEPTVGIDEAGQQQFIALLQSLRERFGLTVILVSHDIRTVLSLADRVACLNVTLHYHDHPDHLGRDTLFEVFHCDFDALHVHLRHKGHPVHETVHGPDRPDGDRDQGEGAE